MASTKAKASRSLPYLPSIDGLRAVAVAAVVGYHVAPDRVPGGFLGVDVFFVISGYLITSLLLAEMANTARVDLRAFWTRRARRLLPALYALVAVVSLVAVLWFHDEVPRFRGDVGASVFYVNNWHSIVVGSSYFERLHRPSPLRHLWSLAVEEQFYVLWPVLLPWLCSRRRRRRDGSIVRVAAPASAVASMLAAGAMASTLLMAVLYHPQVDPSRVYFGTDTRAAPLLVGAFVAVVWRREPWWWTQPVGGLAFAALLAMFTFVHDLDAWLYRGGFLVVAVVTAVAIVAATAPGSVVSTALAWRPLVWLGTRSYGIYLWHWPVVVVTRPRLDVDWSPTVVLLVRLGLTVILAELSWWLVERPVRTGTVRRFVQSLRAPAGGAGLPRWRRTVAVAVGLAVVCGTGSLAAAIVSEPEREDPIAASLRAGEVALAGDDATRAAGGSSGGSVDGVGVMAAAAGDSDSAAPSTSLGPATNAVPIKPVAINPVAINPVAINAGPTTVAPTPTIPRPQVVLDLKVTAVGDSVMLGTARELKAWLGRQAVIDAEVGRQFEDGLTLLQTLRARGRLGDVVIVHLGDNGPPSTRQLDRLRRITENVPALIIVNLSTTLDFGAKANATLARWVAGHAGTALVDWNGVVQTNPGVLYDDKLHVRPLGAALYGQALASAIIKRCDVQRLGPSVPGPVTARVLYNCDRARPPTPSTIADPTKPAA